MFSVSQDQILYLHQHFLSSRLWQPFEDVMTSFGTMVTSFSENMLQNICKV